MYGIASRPRLCLHAVFVVAADGDGESHVRPRFNLVLVLEEVAKRECRRADNFARTGGCARD